MVMYMFILLQNYNNTFETNVLISSIIMSKSACFKIITSSKERFDSSWCIIPPRLHHIMYISLSCMSVVPNNNCSGNSSQTSTNGSPSRNSISTFSEAHYGRCQYLLFLLCPLLLHAICSTEQTCGNLFQGVSLGMCFLTQVVRQTLDVPFNLLRLPLPFLLF